MQGQVKLTAFDFLEERQLWEEGSVVFFLRMAAFLTYLSYLTSSLIVKGGAFRDL